MPQAGLQIHMETLVWLFILALIALTAAKRTRIPYTVALVVIGLVVGTSGLLKGFDLKSDLVFMVLLPPLLFEAAIMLQVDIMKRRWIPVVILAGPGVVATAAIVGFALHHWVGLSLAAALIFGSLISATDTLSVLAHFRRSNVKPELAVLVEGESLFNDGGAAVLYVSVLALVVCGIPLHYGRIAWGIVYTTIGGAAIGLAIGWVVSVIMSRINDHLAEITLTTIAAYGAALAAQSVNVSLVVAVIASGMVLGHFRGEIVMSATSRAAVHSFWEYMAFVINSIFFILIGTNVAIQGLIENIVPVLIAIVVVVLARFIVVYFTGLLLCRTREKLPMSWLHILNAAGLRGALGIALAFSLPQDFPSRGTIIAMTYGVVLWTLLVNGLSLGWVTEKLGVANKGPEKHPYPRMRAMRHARLAAEAEVERIRNEGIVAERIVREFESRTRRESEETERQLDESQEPYGEALCDARRMVRRRLLAAQQLAVKDAIQAGVISRDIAVETLETLFREYGEEEEC